MDRDRGLESFTTTNLEEWMASTDEKYDDDLARRFLLMLQEGQHAILDRLRSDELHGGEAHCILGRSDRRTLAATHWTMFGAQRGDTVKHGAFFVYAKTVRTSKVVKTETGS